MEIGLTLHTPFVVRYFPLYDSKLDVPFYSAAEYTDGQMPARAMVRHDGNVFWPIPTKLQSSCKVDVTYFPFDEQRCKMKFGSWTYDGFQVPLLTVHLTMTAVDPS